MIFLLIIMKLPGVRCGRTDSSSQELWVALLWGAFWDPASLLGLSLEGLLVVLGLVLPTKLCCKKPKPAKSNC